MVPSFLQNKTLSLIYFQHFIFLSLGIEKQDFAAPNFITLNKTWYLTHR